MTPGSAGPARRTVVQRIERLLEVVERARRPPSRREIFHVGDALEHLRAGQYPEAEEAMLRAERASPVPEDAGHRPDTNPTSTIERLRAQLAQAMTGEG